MNDEPNSRRRSFWIGVAVVVVLGVILAFDKTNDGWDARQWLIAGAILLWTMGPSMLGGLLGANLFSRFRSTRTARTGTTALTMAFALLTAILTVVIAQPDTNMRFRPGGTRMGFSSDHSVMLSLQVFMGTVLGGYFARHAIYLQSRRFGGPPEQPEESK